MTIKDLKDVFNINDILSLPEAIFRILFENTDERDKIYNKLIALNCDFSYDWFQNIYEEELSQRHQSKQDFTPNMIGVLLSELTGTDVGRIYEPTAGNGSLIIANWWFRKSTLADKFVSTEHPVECWEMSDRSIPILLLNMSIRGIEAVVYHGDVLSKDVKNKYVLTYREDSPFSEITKV